MNRLKPTVLKYDSLPSTNSEASRLAREGAAEGLCVIAAEQTAGRGRAGRPWISPRGAGIYVSVLLRPSIEMNRWPLLTLMAAVAVHETLKKVCGLEADIKWPNDVLVNGKKICGILAETLETEKGYAVVIGMGLNLISSAFPAELQKTAISLEEATGRRFNVESVLDSLVSILADQYETFDSPGNRIIDAWCRRSSFATGKEIRVSLDNEVIEGTTRGLESDGALRVETIDGTIKVIRAGDVTAVRRR